MNIYQKEGYIGLGPQAQQKKKVYIKKKEVDIRQTMMSARIQASAGGADDEEGEWASAGVPGSWE